MKRTKDNKSEDIKSLIEVNADRVGNTEDAQNTTNAYVLESIGGQMLEYIKGAAASSTEEPVIGVCDALNTVLIYNKLYGQEIIWQDEQQQQQTLPLFSTFFTRLRRQRFSVDDFVYKPTFGGYSEKTMPHPKDASKQLSQLRPLLVCQRTANVLQNAGSDFGWRSLLYINQGDDDPYPTGIVALEAWLFDMNESDFISEKTGKTYKKREGVDCADLDKYAVRIQAIVDYARTLVGTRVQDVSDVREGAFSLPAAAAPSVTDADDDDMAST